MKIFRNFNLKKSLLFIHKTDQIFIKLKLWNFSPIKFSSKSTQFERKRINYDELSHSVFFFLMKLFFHSLLLHRSMSCACVVFLCLNQIYSTISDTKTSDGWRFLLFEVLLDRLKTHVLFPSVSFCIFLKTQYSVEKFMDNLVPEGKQLMFILDFLVKPCIFEITRR